MEYKTRKEVPNEYKWNLSEMYDSSEVIDKDIDRVNKLTPEILKFKSHIMDSADSLYEFLKLTEEQDRILTKLYVYSKMNFDVDTKDNKNKALKMRIEKLNESLSENYSFIEPEMLEASYDTVLKYIEENDKLKEYRFYLETIYRKSMQISDLLNLLFEYVKLDSEGFQLKKTKEDVWELLRECIANLYMDFEEKFKLDIENLKNDLAIENMIVTDDDICILKKYSNNELSMNEAISNIIKGEL